MVSFLDCLDTWSLGSLLSFDGLGFGLVGEVMSIVLSFHVLALVVLF